MPYYLLLDGIDDRLSTPSMTYTEIVMDFKVRTKGAFERYWSLPFSAEYFQVASDGINDQWSAGVTLSVGGVTQTSPSNVMAVGTRRVVRSVFTAKTSVMYIAHNNAASYADMDLYDVKFYNGATLACHYNLTLGTVQDQSGNGRHGTLVGGTFVEDSSGGTDVSTAFATRQNIYASSSAAVATKQAVFANRSDAVATKQVVTAGRSEVHATRQTITAARSSEYATRQLIYSPFTIAAASRQNVYASRLTAFASKQIIYVLRSTAFGTVQTFFDGFAPFSASFATRQAIHRTVTVDQATRQVLYKLVSASYATRQNIYDADKAIVRIVELKGARQLVVPLKGSRQLTVKLRGGLVTEVNQNITMFAGDTTIIPIPVPDVDLKGATIKWAMMRSVKSEHLLSRESPSGITINEDGTEFTIQLDSADTKGMKGSFYHAAKIIDSLGLESTVTTGTITINLSGV